MNAKGNLCASVKGSLGETLLNFSRWMGDGGGHGCVNGTCLQRGEIGVSSIDSLSGDDED